MTERKPHGMSYENWIDKQIREAQERGEFDNLPGAGRPLPGAGTRYDDDWWVNGLLRREEMSVDAMLPESLVLRRDVERLPATVAALRSEKQVRDAVDQVNVRIREWLRMPSEPFTRVSLVDADAVVLQWREARARAQVPVPAPIQPRRRWWRKRR